MKAAILVPPVDTLSLTEERVKEWAPPLCDDSRVCFDNPKGKLSSCNDTSDRAQSTTDKH